MLFYKLFSRLTGIFSFAAAWLHQVHKIVTNKLVHYAKWSKEYCKSSQKLANTQMA